jgi:hypothetical protein
MMSKMLSMFISSDIVIIFFFLPPGCRVSTHGHIPVGTHTANQKLSAACPGCQSANDRQRESAKAPRVKGGDGQSCKVGEGEFFFFFWLLISTFWLAERRLALSFFWVFHSFFVFYCRNTLKYCVSPTIASLELPPQDVILSRNGFQQLDSRHQPAGCPQSRGEMVPSGWQWPCKLELLFFSCDALVSQRIADRVSGQCN